MERLPNWRARLAAALDPLYTAEFAWGQNDCVSGLGSLVVFAILGIDLMEGAPSYRTEAGAVKALRQRGFKGLSEAVGHYLPATPILSARVGDLAVLPGEGVLGASIGMFNTSTILVVTKTGLGHRPWSDATSAFKVG